jgi:acetyl esterase/lipase
MIRPPNLIVVVIVLISGLVSGWYLLTKAEYWPDQAPRSIVSEKVFLPIFDSSIQKNTVQRVDQTRINAGIKLAPDIQYGTLTGISPDQLSLDIYYPADDNYTDWPVIIYVHGGGWLKGDKADDIEDKVNYFTNQKFIFVSINYRLTPGATYPAHHQDIAAAISWIKNNIHQYKGDGARLSLIGHSAGADMIALITTNHQFLKEFEVAPETIRCVVLLDAGGYDLNKVLTKENVIYQQVFSLDPNTLTEASPINHLSYTTYAPRFLIVTRGNRDRTDDAVLFWAKLLATGHSAELIWANSLSHMETDKILGSEKNDNLARMLAIERRNLGLCLFLSLENKNNLPTKITRKT